MAYPWANTFLLALLALELASGLLDLMPTSSDRAIYLQVHRVGGFAILALLLWKGRNILGALARSSRRAAPMPYLSLILLALLLTSITLGLAWSHGGRYSFQSISGLSWQIYLSLVIAPIAVWHTLGHSWSLKPTFWADRRSFLRTGGLALAGLLLWRAGELTADALRLPGAQRRFTVSYERAGFSGNAFSTTSWLNDGPSEIDKDSWRLRIRGHVEREVELTYQEIADHAEEVTATLDCTGGWYSTQEWKGMPLGQVVSMTGPKPGAASIAVRSVTGYYRRFSLREAQDMLLATKVGDEALSHRHGFPLWLVAPGKRGYRWVKLIVAIEVNDTGKWLQPPLPLG